LARTSRKGHNMKRGGVVERRSGKENAAAVRERAEKLSAERGRKEEAVELWRRYVEIVEPSKIGEALLGLGRALVEARRDGEAVDVLRRCVEESPGCLAAHDLLGQVLKQSGSLEAAVEAFKRAAELSPGDVQSRVALVGCLEALGRREEADDVIRALGARGVRDPAIGALIRELLQRRG